MISTHSFPSGRERLAADLYLPDAASDHQRVPGVVTASGFGGVKEMLLPRFAEALADAGIACLVFDYPNFGASTGNPRQHIDIPAQRRAFTDALTALETDPRIDPTRLGVWGPSLAGGHTLTAAASDSRVKAAVAIVPFIALRGRPPLPLILASTGDILRRIFRLERRTIAIAGRPGETAAMTADGAKQWIDEISATATTFRNEVTAASLLQMARYSNRSASAVRTPLRLILAEHDTITPASQARKALRSARHVDIVSHPHTHFELLQDDLPQTISFTVQWLEAHLGPRPRNTEPPV